MSERVASSIGNEALTLTTPEAVFILSANRKSQGRLMFCYAIAELIARGFVSRIVQSAGSCHHCGLSYAWNGYHCTNCFSSGLPMPCATMTYFARTEASSDTAPISLKPVLTTVENAHKSALADGSQVASANAVMYKAVSDFSYNLKAYSERVRDDLISRGYFCLQREKFLIVKYHSLQLTKSGEKLRADLSGHLAEVGRVFPDMVRGDKKQAVEVVARLGTLTLLLPSLQTSLADLGKDADLGQQGGLVDDVINAIPQLFDVAMQLDGIMSDFDSGGAASGDGGSGSGDGASGNGG